LRFGGIFVLGSKQRGFICIGLLNFNAVLFGLECEVCGVNWGYKRDTRGKKIKNEKKKKENQNLILVLFEAHLI
jgi:hypothetical protein